MHKKLWKEGKIKQYVHGNLFVHGEDKKIV
jgi:hypothetical protein